MPSTVQYQPAPATGPSILADLPAPPPRVFTKKKEPPGLPPPIESLRSQKQIVVAIADFEPQEQNDLTLRRGDRITITKSIDQNWYEGELNGRKGIFPKSFVENI